MSIGLLVDMAFWAFKTVIRFFFSFVYSHRKNAEKEKETETEHPDLKSPSPI